MLAPMLLLWLIANFLPQGVVVLLTGKPYFALDPVQGMVVELTIMALNLALPLLALTLFTRDRSLCLRDALAWRWDGWRTVGWGVLGFGLGFVLLFPLVNWAVGSPPFSYGGGIGAVTLRDWPVLFLLLALVVVTPLGEEIMFRGYIQTGQERRHGVAVGWLVAALLFSLRHTPADLYWGRDAPAIQWISRLSQLGGGALIFGWIRHRSRSTISTWIMHLLGWIYVIFG